MNAYIFTGPTLPAEAVRNEIDAVVMPPASQGDVYRATVAGVWGIGVIDGYFERVPAVWHKEILWALSRGVHVFGSASMGALRAAELASFGMRGVGAIFEAYSDGTLEDDDEVTLIHGPAEAKYFAGSEPMVNIRATLGAAAAAGVIAPLTADRLTSIAKALFYAERSYPTVRARAAAEGVDVRELDALHGWLPTGRVDQKRADAIAMCREMRDAMVRDPGPFQARFAFQHTDAWEALKREVDAETDGTRVRARAIERDAYPTRESSVAVTPPTRAD